jgi:hypothetical protein
VRILTTQKSLTSVHLVNFYRWFQSTTLSDHLSFFSLLGSATWVDFKKFLARAFEESKKLQQLIFKKEAFSFNDPINIPSKRNHKYQPINSCQYRNSNKK